MEYRKKSIVDAFKWTEDTEQGEMPEWFYNAIKNDCVIPASRGMRTLIRGIEGYIAILPGDYVVREENGMIFVRKPDVFEANYELVLIGGE